MLAEHFDTVSTVGWSRDTNSVTILLIKGFHLTSAV